MKKLVWILLAILLSPAVLFVTGCSENDCLECKVLELRKNPSSQYYDAVVRIEHIDWSIDSSKSNFAVKTLTGSYEIRDLSFVEDGKNAAELEKGDIFIVPLNRPDWSLAINAGIATIRHISTSTLSRTAGIELTSYLKITWIRSINYQYSKINWLFSIKPNIKP